MIQHLLTTQHGEFNSAVVLIHKGAVKRLGHIVYYPFVTYRYKDK